MRRLVSVVLLASLAATFLGCGRAKEPTISTELKELPKGPPMGGGGGGKFKGMAPPSQK